MIKPDIVCVNPTHIDFPLFRYFLQQNRIYFNNIFIALSKHSEFLNLSEYIKHYYGQIGCIVLDPIVNQRGDWRNNAIHNILNVCCGQRLLFIEQDFIIKNIQFLDCILNNSSSFIGFKESTRWHPGFFLVDRHNLNQTTLNFSAHTKMGDHFALVTHELKKQQISMLNIDTDLSFSTPNDWEHLAGLTHNYTLMMTGLLPNFKLKRLIQYNQLILDKNLNSHPNFMKIIKKIANLQQD